VNGSPETYDQLRRRLGGQPEGQGIEYKSAEVLRDDPDRILREVVGMLNAEVRQVIIGVEERGGLPSRFEGVEEPAKHMSRLRDILLDSIHPRPAKGIPIQSVEVPGTSRAILIIQVPPGEPGLVYAYRRRNYFACYRRLQDRLRPLGWEEVLRDLKRQPTPDLVETGREKLKKIVTKFEESRRQEGLWLFEAVPLAGDSISLDEDLVLKAIADPTLSGNRLMGWTFEVHDPPRKPSPRTQYFESGREKQAFRHLRIFADAQLEFATSLDSLEWGPDRRGGQSGWSLYPFAVVEFPVSLLRLLKLVLRDAPDGDSPVLLQAVFLNVRGSTLPPGRPGAFVRTELKGYRERILRSPEDPLITNVSEIRRNPDRVAFRLLRDTYDAFGIDERNIPFFDQGSETFSFV